MNMNEQAERPAERPADQTVHVRMPGAWYAGLKRYAEGIEGTVHQASRLAVREFLERNGLLAERQV